ncbi:MAG: WG repeat-containing protein [Bacteroidia bacterium]
MHHKALQKTIAVICVGLLLLLSACGEETAFDIDETNWVVVKDQGYAGYIDMFGSKRIERSFAAGKNFGQGYAGVNVGASPKRRGSPLDGKWGFINSFGEFKINPIYQSAKNGVLPYKRESYGTLLLEDYIYNEGFAAVKKGDHWQYIDGEGAVAIEFAKSSPRQVGEGTQSRGYNIKSARSFHGGIAAVQLEKGWGYINILGEIVVPCVYAYAYDPHDGFLMTLNRKGEHFCFNKKGESIFNQVSIASPFSNGIVATKKDFKEKGKRERIDFLEVMDKNGRFTASPEFDYIGLCGSGLLPVRVGSTPQKALEGTTHISAYEFNGGMWGYIDTTGRFIINPTYNETRGFNEGYAPVRIHSRWGYITPSNQYLFKPQFSFASSFSHGLARVRIARDHEIHPQRAAWINRSGDIVWVDGMPNR